MTKSLFFAIVSRKIPEYNHTAGKKSYLLVLNE